MSICCYKTQKIDFRYFFLPRDRNTFSHIEDFVVSFIARTLCRSSKIEEHAMLWEQENCLCVKPLLAEHEGSFPPGWSWISALFICLSACSPCCEWLCPWTRLCTAAGVGELTARPRRCQNQNHCCFLPETNQNPAQTNGGLCCPTTGDTGRTGNKLLRFILETGYRPQNIHGSRFCPKIFWDSFTGKKIHSMICEIQELSETVIFECDRKGLLL